MGACAIRGRLGSDGVFCMQAFFAPMAQNVALPGRYFRVRENTRHCAVLSALRRYVRRVSLCIGREAAPPEVLVRVSGVGRIAHQAPRIGSEPIAARTVRTELGVRRPGDVVDGGLRAGLFDEERDVSADADLAIGHGLDIVAFRELERAFLFPVCGDFDFAFGGL